MAARLVRCLCPRCLHLVVDVLGTSGYLICPSCARPFRPSARAGIPLWVFGALVVLTANLCVIVLW